MYHKLLQLVFELGHNLSVTYLSLDTTHWWAQRLYHLPLCQGCEDSSRGAAASEASCRAPRTRRPAKIPSILFSKNTERCIPWISRPDRVQVQILTHTLAYIPVPSVTQPFLVLHLCQSCLHIHCTFFKARSGTCATLALLNFNLEIENGHKNLFETLQPWTHESIVGVFWMFWRWICSDWA